MFFPDDRDVGPTRSASTTATITPRSTSTPTVCCAWPTRMRRELGLEPGDRFAVMSCNSHEYLELYHAGFLGAGVDQPAEPAPRRQGAAVHPGRLRHRGRVRRRGVRRPLRAQHRRRPRRPAAAPRRADRRRRRAARRPLRGPHRARRPGRPRRAGRGRRRDADVHRRYDRSAQGRAARAAGRDLNLYHIGHGRRDSTSDRVYLHQTPMFHAASMGGVLGIPAIGGASRSSRSSSRRR